MTPPEKSPPPKAPELRPNQVPWGAPKPVLHLPNGPAVKFPAPAAAASKLSANKVPWGSRKPAKPAAPPPPAQDSTVTHMPWTEPTHPPIPPAPPPPEPIVSARKVPWSWGKKPKPAAPPAKKIPEAGRPTESSWARPKGAAAAPDAQEEMEFVREARPADDNEPTAEQLVAFLSKLTSRRKDPAVAASPMTPYKARPISFEPTRWEIFTMRVFARRRQLSVGCVLLLLVLGTAYLLRLVSLNTQIDHEWRAIETALRERYAPLPAYVDCISVFSDDENYALALTQRSLTAWRKARTDQQIAAAAVQLERVMSLLTKIMNRYDQFVPAKDADQEESSQNFILLERQRERSRRETAELVKHYNAVVADFNGKVEGFPGSLIAWTAHLHPHAPIFSSDAN